LKYNLKEDESFLVPDVRKSKLLENYQIKSVPRFLLFDKDGKCLTANALNPSDPGYERYIKNILKSGNP